MTFAGECAVLGEVFCLRERRALAVLKRCVDVERVGEVIVIGSSGADLTSFVDCSRARGSGFSVVWWNKPEMPKADRVAWADILVVVSAHRSTLELWLLGLSGTFARIGGSAFGRDEMVNVFARGLRREGFLTHQEVVRR